MGFITREDIAKSNHFEKVEVDVTEWGSKIDPETGKLERATVFVRELSAREKDDFEASLWRGKGKKREMDFRDMRAKLAVLVCCDAEGKAVFQPDDVEWLSQKPVKPLSRIYDAATQLNGYSEEDEEELLKN